MKAMEMLAVLVLALGLIVCQARVSEAVPMGTAFTYQGNLNDAGSPASGVYDFEFRVYDDPDAGIQQGSTVTIDDQDVIDGYFSVELDFGSGVFDGEARWLEMTVAQSDGSDPCTLSPRQELTLTPYALYAEKAGGDNDWMVSDGNMYSIPPGNVGIGTTSPISRLEVMATAAGHGIRSTVPWIPIYGHRTSTTGTWPGVHGECDSLASNASAVRGVISSTSPGSSSAGVRGINNGTGTTGIGVYGSQDGLGYGVYGFAPRGRGVYGMSTFGHGVYGMSSTGRGVYGVSDMGAGVYGAGFTGIYGVGDDYAGYFQGNVYVSANCSALSFTDRTPYPKDLATAYQAVMSMERLGDGQYDENSKQIQLDHSKLSDFIKSKDGNRDLSATVSALNEVVKDLIRKVEAQQQLIEIQNAQIQQMVKTLQTSKQQPQIVITKGGV